MEVWAFHYLASMEKAIFADKSRTKMRKIPLQSIAGTNSQVLTNNVHFSHFPTTFLKYETLLNWLRLGFDYGMSAQ